MPACRPSVLRQLIGPPAGRTKGIDLPAGPFDADLIARTAVHRSRELDVIGWPLIASHLAEDFRLLQQRRCFDPHAGNAACVLEGADGTPTRRLVHAHGEHLDAVAIRSTKAAAPCLASCSLPTGRRVLQLAMARGASGEARTSRLVVARSMHWVDFLTYDADGGGGDAGSLRRVGSTNFGTRPLHVCPSPTLGTEAACVLSDGQLQLLRLERAAADPSRTVTGASAAAVSSAADVTVFSADVPGVSLTPTGSGGGGGGGGGKGSIVGAWGAVAYAAHPRTLYLASGSGLHLVDVRGALRSPTLLFGVDQLPLPELHAGAIGVPPSRSGAPLVALSSSEQLLLFDIRALRSPLRQWRLPLPLPGPAVLPPSGLASRGAQPQPAPVPHFWLQCSTDGRWLHVIERTNGRVLSAQIDAGTPAGAASAAAASAAAASATASLSASSLPGLLSAPPPALMDHDPDGVIPAACRTSSLWHPHQPHIESHAALPLAGAALLPDPSERGGAEEGGGWDVAVLRGDGGLDCLMAADGERADGERADGERADGGRTDGGRTEEQPAAPGDALARSRASRSRGGLSDREATPRHPAVGGVTEPPIPAPPNREPLPIDAFRIVHPGAVRAQEVGSRK